MLAEHKPEVNSSIQDPVKSPKSSVLAEHKPEVNSSIDVREIFTSVFNSILKNFKKLEKFILSPEPSIAEIDKVATLVVKKRIRKMGIRESGSYNFYKVRVDRGELVTHHERELVNTILTRDPEVEAIVDIGSGIGSILLGFATKGRKATGIEYDTRRVATGKAVIAKLTRTYPAVGNLIHFIHGAFPSVSMVKPPIQGLFVGITTNILGTLTSKTENEIINGLRDFDVCYVDLKRFGTPRKTTEEYEQLLSRMRDVGLTSQELLLDQGKAGYYYRLTKCP